MFWVANTHLVSNYSDDIKKDIFETTRKEQLYLFSEWVKSKTTNSPVIVGGDFNIKVSEKLWEEIPKVFPGYQSSENASTQCTLCPPTPLHKKNEGKVDHLLASIHWKVGVGSVEFRAAQKTKDGFEVFLSDHFGWSTRFGFEQVEP